MTKQKRGFWLFLFSLIPGAGEMYMGFRKQGISIMILFWAIIALAAGTGISWFIMFLPILWFYSFFNVHNLKSLTEEEFYAIEDTYVLHMDKLIGDADVLLKKYRTIVAVLLIIFGIAILWNNFLDILDWLLPDLLIAFLHDISYRIPQIVIAVVIIITGYYLLTKKKSELEQEQKEEEHYWQPYRPYQQPKNAPSMPQNISPAQETSTPKAHTPDTAANQAANASQTVPTQPTSSSPDTAPAQPEVILMPENTRTETPS